jgi:hypothetical protein
VLVLVKFSCLAHEKPLGAMYQCVLLVPPPASTNGRKIDASHKQVKWKADFTVKIGTEVRTLEISVDGQTLKRSRLQLFQVAGDPPHRCLLARVARQVPPPNTSFEAPS